MLYPLLSLTEFLELYFAAGLIIEKLTNLTFSDYMTKKIIHPLGLDDTTYDVAVAQRSGSLADAFLPTKRVERDGILLKLIPYFDPHGGHSAFDPAGGLISNVKDLVGFCLFQPVLFIEIEPR